MSESKMEYIVDGYTFETKQQEQQAQRELEGVKFIKKELDMGKPELVLEIYNHILKEKMFSTPIGYTFLRELQEYLLASPRIDNRYVHPIDFQPMIQSSKESDKEALKLQREKRRQQEREKKKQLKEKKKLSKAERDNQAGKYRRLFHQSVVINIALLAVILGMFLLVHYSDVPTIIDYENKLIDKYEQWETQLNEREQQLRVREEQLMEYEQDN